MTLKPSLLLLASLVTLAACGISGPLEKAPPIFGPDRVAYEAERAKQEAEAKQKAADRAAREAARKQQNTAPPSSEPAPKN
jgi:predicted small lipoprotein YifL